MKRNLPILSAYIAALSLFLSVLPACLHGQWVLPTISGVLPNSATSLGGDCFELVNGTSQRGVVWNGAQMDLSQPFDITLLVWHDVHGADGLALVLQTMGTTANGAGGNANGYANSIPPSAYPGISPSVAVELDMFDNSAAGADDMAADHLAIHVNGDLAAAASGPNACYPGGNNVPDNTCLPLRVVWTPAPTNALQVFWDNQLRLIWNQDIVANVFGGNSNVFWGITASCGGVYMTQRVCVGADFAQAGPDITVCEGDTVQLNATGGGTYLWGLGLPQISDPSIANPLFISTTAQTLSLPLMVTNILGCVDEDTTVITVIDGPSVAISGPSAICPGESAQLIATASGGTAPYTFAWSTGQTTDTVLVQPFATTGITVTATDANGCSIAANMTLTVHPQEFVDILNADTSLCLGGGLSNINTTGSAGIDTYLWTPSQGVSNTSSPVPSIIPTQSTTYYLTATNSTTGCSGVDSLRIDVYDLQMADFPDSTVCLGDTVRITLLPTGGSGDYDVQWIQTGGDTLSNDTVLDPYIVAGSGGTYFAQVTDNQTGCMQSMLTTITVKTIQVLATPSSILINPGQRVQMEAFGAMTYVWEPDTMLSCANCPAPVSMPSSSIVYTVTGTDTAGCQGIATVNILTDSLFIPNLFSPNGDGINDVLMLNYHGTALYQIVVFDRWGREIFQTQDKLVMWDGKTSGGIDAPEGVYYLAVRILGDDAIPEKDKQRAFHVTLMR